MIPTAKAKNAFAIFFKAFIKSWSEIFPFTLSLSKTVYANKHVKKDQAQALILKQHLWVKYKKNRAKLWK